MFRSRTIAIVLVLAIVAVFAVAQWGQWQTGRAALDPLKLTPGGPAVVMPGRIWIDTDAACGATTRTDPDDCLAILWLVGLRTSLVADREAIERLKMPDRDRNDQPDPQN